MLSLFFELLFPSLNVLHEEGDSAVLVFGEPQCCNAHTHTHTHTHQHTHTHTHTRTHTHIHPHTHTHTHRSHTHSPVTHTLTHMLTHTLTHTHTHTHTGEPDGILKMLLATGTEQNTGSIH